MKAASNSKPGEPTSVERRREERTDVTLPVQVYGKHANGFPFLPSARASNVSVSGARIEGTLERMRAGDVVGLNFNGKEAPFRVAWVLNNEGSNEGTIMGIVSLDPHSRIWDSLRIAEKARPHCFG